MLVAESVLQIDIHQQIVQCLALILCPCCNLANQTDAGWRILVAYLVVGQEAEALLTTANVFLLAFAQGNLACNPLKASVAVAQFDIVLLSHLGNNLCCYNGLNEEVTGLQCTQS